MTFGNINSEGKFVPSEGYTEQLAKKDAEIERLSRELTAGVALNHRMAKESSLLCAEIERLRDLLGYYGIDPDAVVESAKGAAATYKKLKDKP
jgi:hypothetical protein